MDGSKIENSIWSHFIFLKSCIKMGEQSQNSKAWLAPKSKTRFGGNRPRQNRSKKAKNRYPKCKLVDSKIKNSIWSQPGTQPRAPHSTPARASRARPRARPTSAPPPTPHPHPNRPRYRRQHASTIANLGARSRKNTKKLNLNLTLLLSYDIWARDSKKALYVVAD